MSRNTLWGVSIVAALAFVVGHVSAQVVVDLTPYIVNPSFEDTRNVAETSWSDSTSGTAWANHANLADFGWTISGAIQYTGVMNNGHGSIKEVPHGNTDDRRGQVAYTDGGTFSQILTELIEGALPNAKYTLTVMTARCDTLLLHDNGTGVELWAGDTRLGFAPLEWETERGLGYFVKTELICYTGDIVPNGLLEIRLVNGGPLTDDDGHNICGGKDPCWYFSHRVAFDMVTLTVTTVPEPATMSLLALGGLAMLRRQR